MHERRGPHHRTNPTPQARLHEPSVSPVRPARWQAAVRAVRLHSGAEPCGVPMIMILERGRFLLCVEAPQAPVRPSRWASAIWGALESAAALRNAWPRAVDLEHHRWSPRLERVASQLGVRLRRSVGMPEVDAAVARLHARLRQPEPADPETDAPELPGASPETTAWLLREAAA